MPHIERRQTAVRMCIAGRFDGVAANVGAGIQRFAPCVRKEEVIPRGETLLQLRRESVITGVTHTIEHVDRSEIGIWPAALQRLILERYVGIGQPGLIVVGERRHVMRLVPHIADFQHKIRRKALLDIEIPLAGVRPLEIFLNGEK